MNTQHPQRKYPRLKAFDYRSFGAYFFTTNVRGRRPLLAKVVGDRVSLSGAGRIVLEGWKVLPSHYPDAVLDEFIVMPDHVHGIVWLSNAASSNGPGSIDEGRTAPLGRHSLTEVIRGFKTLTSREINASRNSTGTPFWQRSFYERVIRSERELNAAREYIQQNPLRWSLARTGETNGTRGGRV